MIVYNDLEPSEKVKVYDKGVTLADDPEKLHQLRIGYRAGDVWAPQLATREGLAAEVEHFADCIANNRVPETDGMVGLRVVELLEAASSSLGQRGRPIELKA